MPIYNTSSHIIITHKVVGKDELINPLSDMAVETCMMLEAHQLDIISKKYTIPDLTTSTSSTTNGISTNTTDIPTDTNSGHGKTGNTDTYIPTGIEAAKKNRTNLSWLTRAYKAASVHEPPISKSFGELTPHGEYLMDVAYRTMDKLYNVDPNYARPHTMPDPDDWFIQLRMPIRAFRMLKGINRVINEAELHFSLNGPRQETWEEIVANFKKTQNNPQSSQNQASKTPIYAEDPNELFIMEPTYNLDLDNQTPQQFETITIQTKDLSDPDVPIGRTTIVPTSIFGQKARTDLKLLIRYCLVDVRVIRHGGRGRPKQAILVSDIGKKLAEHDKVQELY